MGIDVPLRATTEIGYPMTARITTTLPCTAAELWRHIADTRSLVHVCRPVLGFVRADGRELSGPWEVGLPYELKLRFLMVVPMGRHVIRLETVDPGRNLIISRENGLLARVWNHTITFEEVSPGRLRYTDEIEIRAGLLTPAIWLFAQLFYRHRQRRWKQVVRGAILPEMSPWQADGKPRS